MATFVDQMLLELGFDTAKLVKSAKESQDAIKKTREEFEKHGKGIEKANESAFDSVDHLLRGVMSLYAGLVGVDSIGAFIDKITKLDAATSRVAASLGMTVTGVSQLDLMAERMGSSGDSMNNMLRRMNDAFLDLKYNSKELPPALAQIMKISGVNINYSAKAGDELNQIAAAIQKVAKARGERDAYFLAHSYTQDDALIAGMIEHGDKFKEYQDKMAPLATTPAQAKAAKEREEALAATRQTWTDIGHSVLDFFSPQIVSKTKQLTWLGNQISGKPLDEQAEAPAVAAASKSKLDIIASTFTLMIAEVALKLRGFKMPSLFSSAEAAELPHRRPFGALDLNAFGTVKQEGREVSRGNPLAVWITNPAGEGGASLYDAARRGGADSMGHRSGGFGSPGEGGGYGGAQPHMFGDRKQVANIVASAFRKEGVTDEGLAGMFANIQDESHFTPGILGLGGDFGIWQLTGTERRRYEDWLAQNHPGANPADPNLQTAWQIQNLKKHYPKLWARMHTHDKPGSIALDFLYNYENPPGKEPRASKYRRAVPPVSSYGVGAPQSSIAPAIPNVAVGANAAPAVSNHNAHHSSISNSHHIGEINIQTAATDAHGIAHSIRDAMRLDAFARTAEEGLA